MREQNHIVLTEILEIKFDVFLCLFHHAEAEKCCFKKIAILCSFRAKKTVVKNDIFLGAIQQVTCHQD